MRFAKWVFTAAGIYGLICLTPFLFLEGRIAAPAAQLAHAEYFYGFVWVAIACQVLFLLIGRDPVRLRAAMIPSVIEKWPFAVMVFVLWGQGRVQLPVVGFACVDILWGALFAIAWLRTPKA
jgi:hypothetical protein